MNRGRHPEVCHGNLHPWQFLAPPWYMLGLNASCAARKRFFSFITTAYEHYVSMCACNQRTLYALIALRDPWS